MRNAADLKGVAVEQSYVRKYEDKHLFCPYHRLYRQGSGGSAVRPWNEQWHQSDEAAACRKTLRTSTISTISWAVSESRNPWAGASGRKGLPRMYVDNMGRPREIIEKTDAKPGMMCT